MLAGFEGGKASVSRASRREAEVTEAAGDRSFRALKAAVIPGLCSKAEGQLSSSGMRQHDSVFQKHLSTTLWGTDLL